MIVLKNVSKEFKGNTIVENVNIKLEKGNIYGFQGRNGSGKTVLFKMICGFLESTTGEIYVNNKQIGKDRDFPAKCGVLIENPGFIEGISGYKNLKLLGSINNTVKDKVIQELMDYYELDYSSNKKVKDYSLGMKQKLGIIQAVMEDPKIVVLDEPMNALDKKSVERTRRLLNEIKKDKIILITSHNQEDLNELCDEIFLIEDGVIRNK